MLCPEPYGAMRLMRHNAQRRAVQQMVAETRRRMTQQGCMARMKMPPSPEGFWGAWAAKTPDGARAGNRAAAMRRRRRAILAASPRHPRFFSNDPENTRIPEERYGNY
ncbi:hypothetical protein BCY84_12776 [Trypanosoma cruzi cruzi]|nr:hypothetical protein BCY84_12776 [Trypanosoma cruzi cruzi]